MDRHSPEPHINRDKNIMDSPTRASIQSYPQNNFAIHTGSPIKRTTPLGQSDSGSHYIKPVPPTYVTEYESAYIKPPPIAYQHDIFKSRHDPSIDATSFGETNSCRASLFKPPIIKSNKESINSPLKNYSSSILKTSPTSHKNWKNFEREKPPIAVSTTNQNNEESIEKHNNTDACIRDAYMDIENILQELLRLGYEKTYINAVMPIVRSIRASFDIDKNVDVTSTAAINAGSELDYNIEYLYQHIKLRILSNQVSGSDHFDRQSEKILQLCSAFVDAVDIIKQLLH